MIDDKSPAWEYLPKTQVFMNTPTMRDLKKKDPTLHRYLASMFNSGSPVDQVLPQHQEAYEEASIQAEGADGGNDE